MLVRIFHRKDRERVLFQTYINHLDNMPPGFLLGQAVAKAWAISTQEYIQSPLREAKLWRADMRNMCLRYCDMTGARLDRALLTNADLSFTILDDASFVGTDLRNANLYGASLRRANLDMADLRGARLNACDLREATLPSGMRIPYIDNIDEMIKVKWPEELARSLHGSRRAHLAVCLAGKQGIRLASKYGAETAAALIYQVSRRDLPVPNFALSEQAQYSDLIGEQYSDLLARHDESPDRNLSMI
jgi:hypothetical protein